MPAHNANNRTTVEPQVTDESLAAILSAVDVRQNAAAYIDAARRVAGFHDQLRPAKVALLSSFTIEPLLPFLRVEAARQKVEADIYVGPFGTVQQELLRPDSGCVAHRPDVVFVSQLLEDLCAPLASDFLGLGSQEVDAHIDDIVSGLVTAITTFRRLSSAHVVVNNFTPPASPLLGIYEPMAESSQTDMIARLNRRLVDALRSVPGAYVLNYSEAAAFVGHRHWYNEKMWYLARAPLSAVALQALAKRQAAFLRALLMPPYKCLVLDLDDTLWGGVVAERGVSGIDLGLTFPGVVYRDFQSYLLQLHRRGVLLAINSKNNLADVDDVFDNHPHMVLKREHFAAIRANWDPKPDNMVSIGSELNLGLDSFVFFDDSSVECALMQEALPDILTLQAPKDPAQSRHILTESGAFERVSLTKEDLRRGEMYQAQAARNQHARAASSIDEFLAGLKMTARIARVDDFAFPRVLDLLQKTNQFNLTTRRHSAAELQTIAADHARGVFSLQLTDRFGDNGIVGAAIVGVDDRIAIIDSFLLSCRVIGRTAETALLAYLVGWARVRGAEILHGEFLPTAKNAPAADFYQRHGFTQVPSQGPGSLWELDLRVSTVEWSPFIRSISGNEHHAVS